jgi:hypothetical protein
MVNDRERGRWLARMLQPTTFVRVWGTPSGVKIVNSLFVGPGRTLRGPGEPSHNLAGTDPGSLNGFSLADLEGPGEVRRRVEIELGSPVEEDLGDTEILAEVELLAATGREDVHRRRARSGARPATGVRASRGGERYAYLTVQPYARVTGVCTGRPAATSSSAART